MIDLNEMARDAFEIAKKRQENGAALDVTAEGMIKHAATEVVEAAMARQGMAYVELMWTRELANELADIIMCALIAGEAKGFDMEKALKSCLEKNRLRAEGKGDKK